MGNQHPFITWIIKAMQHYSERCSDWLEKNANIHPDKIDMEIRRFRSMLENAEKQSVKDQDSLDDLLLTVQLLEERRQNYNSSLNSHQLTDTTKETDSALMWDTGSLTDHDTAEPEKLPEDIKALRKAELLEIPGVQLGIKNLKEKPL